MTYSKYDNDKRTHKDKEAEPVSAHQFTVGELKLQESSDSRLEQIKRNIQMMSYEIPYYNIELDE